MHANARIFCKQITLGRLFKTKLRCFLHVLESFFYGFALTIATFKRRICSNKKTILIFFYNDRKSMLFFCFHTVKYTINSLFLQQERSRGL